MQETYRYSSAEREHTADYVWSPVVEILRSARASSVLDIGCGNGAFCAHLAGLAFDVAGCDPSADGIRIARAEHVGIPFHQIGVYDDPLAIGRTGFDAVVAVEVIEHLHSPRELLRFARAVLKPSGMLVVTTPYHGYLKNLALSVVDGWDRHLSPFWDGGHVKFWSKATLTRMMVEERYSPVGFAGAGRIRWLWKSMILFARPM